MTTTSTTRFLLGKVRNIQPNRSSPRWEVCFDPKLWADDFPSTHETWINVEWPSGTYRTMVGIKPGNWIYLRTAAVSVDGGPKTRVTDLCERHGFDHSGRIAFEVIEPLARYRVTLA